MGRTVTSWLHPPPPLSSQNIESKRPGKTFPRKIFHRKELEVKIFHSKDLRGRKSLQFWHSQGDGVNQVVIHARSVWQLTTDSCPSPPDGREKHRPPVASVSPSSPMSSYESTCTTTIVASLRARKSLSCLALTRSNDRWNAVIHASRRAPRHLF